MSCRSPDLQASRLARFPAPRISASTRGPAHTPESESPPTRTHPTDTHTATQGFWASLHDCRGHTPHRGATELPRGEDHARMRIFEDVDCSPACPRRFGS